MITQLYLIYVNHIKRAIFDGSLNGFKRALLSIDIQFENLVKPVYGEGLVGSEVEELFLSFRGQLATKGDAEYSDSMGIYLRILGYVCPPDSPFVPPHFSEDEL